MAQTGPAAMLREFYTAYISAMDTGHSEKRLTALEKKYCTTRLLNRLPKLADKIDADPLIKAQDAIISSGKTLTVEGDPKKEGHYVVSYTADHKVVVNVMVVNQNGKYKIDDVW